MHSPSSSLVFLISSANSFVLFTWCLEVPTKGSMILANSLANIFPYRPREALLLDSKSLSVNWKFISVSGIEVELKEVIYFAIIFILDHCIRTDIFNTISGCICRSWFSLEQNCWFIEDKLSSTAVDFIRPEGIVERQHRIWGKESSLSMPRTYRGVKSVT